MQWYYSRIASLWIGLLVIASSADAQQACLNPLLQEHLNKQEGFLEGDRQSITAFLDGSSRADLSVMVSEDQYLNVCNSALFKITVVSQLLGEQLGAREKGTVAYKVTAMRLFAHALNEYASLIFDLEERGLSRDPLTQDVKKIVRMISNSGREIVLGNSDQSILPHNIGHGAEFVYRVLTRIDEQLTVLEFSVRENQTVLETEFPLTEFQRKLHRFDTIVVPFRLDPSWLSFAKELGIDILSGDQGYIFFASKNIVLPFILRRESGKESLRETFKSYLSSIYNAVDRIEVQARPIAEFFFQDEFKSDETNTQSVCVRYLTPEDNDLFVYRTTEAQNPLFLDLKRTTNSFRILSGPFNAEFTDDLEKTVNGRPVHRGHRVLKWIEIEVAGEGVFMVYEKSTLSSLAYVRFEETGCVNK